MPTSQSVIIEKNILPRISSINRTNEFVKNSNDKLKGKDSMNQIFGNDQRFTQATRDTYAGSTAYDMP